MAETAAELPDQDADAGPRLEVVKSVSDEEGHAIGQVVLGPRDPVGHLKWPPDKLHPEEEMRLRRERGENVTYIDVE